MKSRLFTCSAIGSLGLFVICAVLWACSYSSALIVTSVNDGKTVSHQAAISQGGVLFMSRHFPSVAYGTAGLSFTTSAPADLSALKNWSPFSIRFRRAGFGSYALSTPRVSMRAYIVPAWVFLLMTIPLPAIWMCRRRVRG
jgi:hypothetical protein